LGRAVVITGCTESPMVNGTWAITSGLYTSFSSQNAVPNPVLVGVPNRLVGGTGTVTLTGGNQGEPSRWEPRTRSDGLRKALRRFVNAESSCT
jgi:hypothetical protein